MKRLLMLTAVFSALGLQAQWSKLNSFAGSNRYAASSFILNNKAYIMGGLTQNSLGYTAYNQLWVYNDSADTWSQLANYPGGNMYGGVSFVIDSMAYVGLGADENGNRSKQLWAYNPKTDSWTPKASLPGNERTYPFSFSANGKGYVGGGDRYSGTNRIYMNDFWEYDPTNDSWTQKTDYPGTGRVGMVGWTINGMGYAGLGDDGSSFYSDFFGYNATTDSWNALATFPGPNRSFAHAIGFNQMGYILGGEDVSQNFVNDMWTFDPSSNTWVASVAFTGMNRVSAIFFALNGELYYGLGLEGSPSFLSSKEIWKFRPPNFGVDDVASETNLSVYPNPVSNVLYVDVSEEYSGATFQLLDTRGVLIDQGVLDANSTLNLEGAAEGLYLLKVKTEKLETTIKVIKE